MKKRILSVAACVFLLLTMLLSACTPTEGTSGSTSAKPTPSLREDCTHVDANDDGACDNCGGDVTVALDFYALNDLHGVFMDTATNPGVDELTAYLKNAYADDSAYEIVLSSGDMWQGSVESSSNKGRLMTEWMNELGFVSMTLGNHEYDWGSANLAQNADLAQFPLLGINVNDTNVDELYCQPSTVVERGGVKIGIIGAVSNWLSSISGEFTDGLEFITGDALTQLVKTEATRLREQEGCDLVVYSIHDGTESSYSDVQNVASLEYYDVALSDGYIDLVFEAHTHQDYVLQDSYGVYHLQAGGYNSAVSYASVRYNTLNDTYNVQTATTVDIEKYAASVTEGDTIVTELFDRYFSEENPYTDVLGYNTTQRSSNDIVETVAQLYLEKGRALWGDTYEIVLGGGFLQCRTPYKLSAGNVTYSQLFALMPFDNDLVLCEVTGKQLNDIFIHSRNDRYHCAYDKDMVVDENATYYVVTDTYTSFYRYNMLKEVARAKTYARDLLKDYIAAGNWDVSAQKITIKQALDVGEALGDGQSAAAPCELTGTISAMGNGQYAAVYGNLYLSDGEGNTIYLYGLCDRNGVRYDKMENPPKVGDTITVVGTITKYVGGGTPVIEIQNAVLK